MEIETTIGSMIVGGLITFFLARYYYQKASNELKGETKKLRDLIKMILHGLEIANLVTVNWDADGNPISYNLKINVHDTISLSGSTSPVLTETKQGEGGEKGGETD